MNREEAEAILKDVSCRCDGYGLLPGPDGKVVKCESCDGIMRSNQEIKEARLVIK